MQLISWIALMVCWFAWAYPFIFRAPHRQKRESISASGATLVGLMLEGISIFIAFVFRLPDDQPAGFIRMPLSLICGPIAALLSWDAVAHLGRQFRVTAGIYHDHELVTTGPYAIVRHPIYTSLLAILLCTLLLLTPWPWIFVSLVFFVSGTEVRVRAEDQLLASRFGEAFERYRKSAPAYIPFVR